MSPDFDKDLAFTNIKAFSTLETQAVSSILTLVQIDDQSDSETLELQTILAKAAITSLYTQASLRIKLMVITAFQPTKKVTESLTNAKAINSFLLNRGLDLTSLTKYAAFDEVRLLSNSVSHNGYVKTRDPLCEVYGWHVGQLPGHKIINNFSKYELASTELCEEIKLSLIATLSKLK